MHAGRGVSTNPSPETASPRYCWNGGTLEDLFLVLATFPTRHTPAGRFVFAMPLSFYKVVRQKGCPEHCCYVRLHLQQLLNIELECCPIRLK
ncbi:hypothetical protein AVEN_12719-1 [Araneus ventricosus]|uniref:Uncharacterized protein n=1 Tax=Araneus ventricosus TaxID=182803 RepID=A0A4Y2AB48_ARAVE|nr:hypothetical protein AVEN_12719-1 [Araneus ventricosus]